MFGGLEGETRESLHQRVIAEIATLKEGNGVGLVGRVMERVLAV